MSVAPIKSDLQARSDQASRLREMLGQPRLVESNPAPLPRPRLIALASGKGGVGKTLTSISLATAIANLGQRVVLIDADFGAANADIMLGLSPLRRLDECFRHRFGAGHGLSELAIDSGAGFRLVPGAVGLGRPPGAGDRAMLLDDLSGLESSTDVVLVDCSAGVGVGVLDMASPADLTAVVLTPEPTAIADAYALIKSLVIRDGAEAGDRLGLIVNQVSNRAEALRVHRRICAVAHRFLGIRPDLLGWVPSDRAIPRGVREQRIVARGKVRSAAGKTMKKAAKQILARLDRDKSS
ncbi:MAG TPA: hypothetical protein ENJ00_11180 [Phycisphaerales bacterium]|nr:hypothetical protein [Phycisphaerales bacterium]